MATRVAINGFGRTGRAAFRAAYERGADVEFVAINDIAEPAMLAQLLRHDSVYGPFPGQVTVEEGAIVVDGQPILAPSETEPGASPGMTWASTSSSSRRVASAPARMPSSISTPARAR
jgi:glyceraldehyde 3-phosphate dehydrogenase